MFDEALIGIVEAISASMFGAELTLLPLADSGFDRRALTATIGFEGDFSGELRATFTEPLARVLTGAMMQEPQPSFGHAELWDAVGELANIIAGNLKGLLPGACQASLPSVQVGSSIIVRYPNVQLGRALFRLFGEPMWVELTRTRCAPSSDSE